MAIDTFIGHSFVIHVNEKETDFNPEKMDAKKSHMFTMATYDDVINIHMDQDGAFYRDNENAFTKTKKTLLSARDECLENGKEMSFDDDMLACLSNHITTTYTAPKERAATKSRKMLELVSDRSRNYTCADPLMETTATPSRTFSYGDSKASVFLEDKSAQIIVLENFVKEEECTALMERAEPHLVPATVAGSSMSTLSSSRRAKAASVNPTLSAKPGVDPVTDLFRRGYKFANDQTGYDLNLEGQEGFSVIKYDSTDEYLPHCDGSCAGDEHQKGGRVCTMVVYCQAAEVGGGTTFSAADVFVKGKRGDAVFFSYYDKDTEIMDDGYTRHSGCPIITGEKWVATMWMRKGVSTMDPHTNFDPSGVRAEDYEQRKKWENTKKARKDEEL